MEFFHVGNGAFVFVLSNRTWWIQGELSLSRSKLAPMTPVQVDEDDGDDGHGVLQQVGVRVDVAHPAVLLRAALLDQDGSVLLDAFLVLLPVKLLDQVVEGDHPQLHDLERSALHEKERKGKGHEAVVKVRQGLKECVKSRQCLKSTPEKFQGDGSRTS